MDPYYIVVFDKDLGWCRLFRSDSEDCPSDAESLWKGYNLEIGYEEMKRLNRERRKIPSYYVCERETEWANKKAYGIKKEKPALPWVEVDFYHEYSKAQEKVRELCAARDKANAEFKAEVSEKKKSFMDRFGIRSANFRLDEKSHKYLEWLISENRLSAEDKENIDWLQENGIIKAASP